MRKNSFSCPVEFVRDVFGESPVLADLLGGRRVLIVADSNVVHQTPGLGTRIGAYVQAHGLALAGAPLVLGGGEKAKNDDFKSAVRALDALAGAKLESDDFVLALGGGAVLDVAGWAAAQYRRGVRLVRVPTTPSAMVDAAFATTAALDWLTEKDAFSLPSVPAAVLIDCAFAATVMDGVWRSGLVLALRQAAAAGMEAVSSVAAQVGGCLARDPAAFEALVRQIVELVRANGPSDLARATAARIEADTAWKTPYGYAIAAGLMAETEGDLREELRRTLANFLPPNLPFFDKIIRK